MLLRNSAEEHEAPLRAQLFFMFICCFILCNCIRLIQSQNATYYIQKISNAQFNEQNTISNRTLESCAQRCISSDSCAIFSFDALTTTCSLGFQVLYSDGGKDIYIVQRNWTKCPAELQVDVDDKLNNVSLNSIECSSMPLTVRTVPWIYYRGNFIGSYSEEECKLKCQEMAPTKCKGVETLNGTCYFVDTAYISNSSHAKTIGSVHLRINSCIKLDSIKLKRLQYFVKDNKIYHGISPGNPIRTYDGYGCYSTVAISPLSALYVSDAGTRLSLDSGIQIGYCEEAGKIGATEELSIFNSQDYNSSVNYMYSDALASFALALFSFSFLVTPKQA